MCASARPSHPDPVRVPILISPPSPTDDGTRSIDDYDAFKSPLSDFEAEVKKAGFENRIIYLTRGEEFTF